MDKPVSKNNVSLKTVAWLVGALAIIVGITLLTSQTVAAIFWIIAGAVLFPPVASFVAQKSHLVITRNQRIATAVVLIIIAGIVSAAQMPSVTVPASVPVATAATTSIPMSSTTSSSSVQDARPNTAATKPSASVQSEPAVAEAATPAHVPSVLLDLTGEGTKSTQSFSVPGDWSITYSYDCSNFDNSGNFQIYIKNSDGSFNDLPGANELGAGGSDTDYYHESGSYYLEMNSECKWHVTVKG